ncbi:hypothetical protein PF005_g16405 [Phytophthora fragariae]|uniref:Uncharacterized protein n=1 Tax=Phytophthora fragariae TaxID=53985 RepID=A0A6A3IXH5_9STRA|nr:hypothetical protein PF003_g23610 [Phytophthora fragariae]KAE8924075.1 hypothetical protein PF009_g25688 [Phytophthora fragariae]KAE8987839.1 hypothetical protein PF011_g19415 [Phytophthora fragariae]KAE9075642.1 hypothetical protein PF007_g24920 [Phytophthora fragariae]KAE9097492.1 hypothetical protein PF010_g15946 [Phytophthora fragariae]
MAQFGERGERVAELEIELCVLAELQAATAKLSAEAGDVLSVLRSEKSVLMV